MEERLQSIICYPPTYCARLVCKRKQYLTLILQFLDGTEEVTHHKASCISKKHADYKIDRIVYEEEGFPVQQRIPIVLRELLIDMCEEAHGDGSSLHPLRSLTFHSTGGREDKGLILYADVETRSDLIHATLAGIESNELN